MKIKIKAWFLFVLYRALYGFAIGDFVRLRVNKKIIGMVTAIDGHKPHNLTVYVHFPARHRGDWSCPRETVKRIRHIA